MSARSESPARPPLGRTLDRWVTRLLHLGGRVLGRPNEPLLNRLTGRSKGGGGPSEGEGLDALLAARRALEVGHFGDALHLFGRAAELLPDDPWPWHGRGDALQLSGQHAAALSAYEEALARAPGLALSVAGRGNALEGLGRPDEAEAAWQEALRLDPALPWPREGLARLRARR